MGDKKDKEKAEKAKKRKRVTLEGFAASVELPEGHQLIIGELPAGTVVEVATWQGVGRPDASTNRFLLTADGPGMQPRRREERDARDDIDLPKFEDPTQSRAESKAEEKAEREPEVKAQEANASEQKAESKPVAPDAEQKKSDEKKSDEKKSDEKKAKKREIEAFLGVTQLEKPDDPTAATSTESKSFANRWKRIAPNLFAAVASIAIILVILNILGISLTVPNVGSKSTFGNTTNSLVLYKRGNNLVNNSPTVVANVVNGKREILLGAATVYSSTEIELSTTKGFMTENSDSVIGHSVVAIPFLGWLLSPLFH